MDKEKYEIVTSETFEKQLEGLPDEDRINILSAMAKLAEDPYSGSSPVITSEEEDDIGIGLGVHVWTLAEIKDQESGGWFYGLVKNKNGDIVVCEIHPGLGYTDVYMEQEEDDTRDEQEFLKETYSWIGHDVVQEKPE